MSINEKRAYDYIKELINDHVTTHNISLNKLWYRGEAGLYPTMPSSLYRQINFDGEPEQRRVTRDVHFNKVHNYERWIYEKFKSELEQKDPVLYKNVTQNGWDIVFYMQHYGIPTRFIDWSEDMNTSLFFATEKADENTKDVVLWLFDPNRLNEITRGVYQLQHPEQENNYSNFVHAHLIGMEQKIGAAISPHSHVLGVYASGDIERMHEQYGHFVFIPKGYNDFPLYVENIAAGNSDLQEKVLKKIVIPNSEAREIKKYLESIGCNREKYKLNDNPLIDGKEYSFEKFSNR